MDQMSPKRRMQLLPIASDKLRPSIRNDRLQNSMHAYHTSYVDLNILLNLVAGVDGYEVSGFDESVHDQPNRIKLVGSQRQIQNEIHAYVVSLLISNTQWLQQSSRLHIVTFNVLIGIAF
jgi:hypothetical protein